MSSLPPPPPLGDLPANFDGTPMNHKRAIASLVFGVLGIIILPVVFGLIAIVLGVQARQAIRQQPHFYKGDSTALAGIVLGVLDIVAFVAIIAYG